MSTLSDHTDSIHSFIEEKSRYEDEGWEFVYIFESRFIPENCKIYGNVMKSLEEKIEGGSEILASKMSTFLKHNPSKKRFETDVRAVKIMHPATKSGFLLGGAIFLDDELEKNFSKENPVQFLEQFSKIVSDKKFVPDKTVIILSKDPHHMMTEKSAPQSRKRSLDDASKRKGQKLMTDFLQKVKNATTSAENSKSPAKNAKNELQVEKITQKLRGELVKILWIPKDNLEVDPSQYLSIFLLNEIASACIEAPKDTDLMDVVKDAIDVFPDGMWTRVVTIAEKFEDSYFEDDDEEQQEAES